MKTKTKKKKHELPYMKSMFQVEYFRIVKEYEFEYF